MGELSNISKNISWIRKKYKLSQKDFGELIGKRNGVVSSYEKGNAAPPIDVLVLIGRKFDFSIDDLLTVDLSKEKFDDIEFRKLEQDAILFGEKDNENFRNQQNALKNVISNMVDYRKLLDIESSIFGASNYLTYYHSHFIDEMFKDISGKPPYIKDVKAFAAKYKKEIQAFKNLIDTYSNALLELQIANKKFDEQFDFLKVYELPEDFFTND